MQLFKNKVNSSANYKNNFTKINSAFKTHLQYKLLKANNPKWYNTCEHKGLLGQQNNKLTKPRALHQIKINKESFNEVKIKLIKNFYKIIFLKMLKNLLVYLLEYSNISHITYINENDINQVSNTCFYLFSFHIFLKVIQNSTFQDTLLHIHRFLMAMSGDGEGVVHWAELVKDSMNSIDAKSKIEFSISVQRSLIYLFIAILSFSLFGIYLTIDFTKYKSTYLTYYKS